MKIEHFTHSDLEQARAIALANYREEQAACSALPEISNTPSLNIFAENGLGVAAFEGSRMLGFLCCYSPWEEAWDPAAMGTYSPIHAHGAVAENRTAIYQRMYESAAEIWRKQGISYHGIGLYAHDAAAIGAFFDYGFGKRCMDEIRNMDSIPAAIPHRVQFCELPFAEFPEIRELRKALSAHLGESPCFMVSSPEDTEHWIARVEAGDRRTFVVKDSGGNPLAYLDFADDGETFITDREDMINCQGAYCMPAYRGTGLMDALLDYCIHVLKAEGFQYMGVDHESFNPTALHYWRKHFTPYTNSLVRRLDECALRK